MIPVEDAQARILAACAPLPARSMPLAEALGRVLAQPVVSGVDGHAPRLPYEGEQGGAVGIPDLPRAEGPGALD